MQVEDERKPEAGIAHKWEQGDTGIDKDGDVWMLVDSNWWVILTNVESAAGMTLAVQRDQMGRIKSDGLRPVECILRVVR